MPIDPEISSLLGNNRSYAPAEPEKLDAASFRSMPGRFPAIEPVPIDIRSVRTMALDFGDRKIRGRLYDNTNGSDSLIYFVHGGGFVAGDLDSYDRICRKLARATNSKVFAVEYRLAPENRFPAALDDVRDAYDWVIERSGELGFSPGKVALVGDSAGGGLCASLSLLNSGRKAAKPRFQVLLYPVMSGMMDTDSYSEFDHEPLLTRGMMAWFFRQYASGPEDIKNPLLSPLLADSFAGTPDTLIVSAESDVLRDEGEIYAGKLRSENINATCLRAMGMVHGFISITDISKSASGQFEVICSYIAQKFMKM